MVRLRLGGGGGVAFFGEKGGRESGAGGSDASDVAVGFGKTRGEGGAEVGCCDEEVVGRGAGVVFGDVVDWDVASCSSALMSVRTLEDCVSKFAKSILRNDK